MQNYNIGIEGVNSMKKLSEVCKIVGVTRRTLQEYNKIGLLKPTSKTESGYWLYDDSAIQTLTIIQIFVEVGYERKVIKSILESPTLDLLTEYDHLIEVLEEKRKRIDGMINTIKIHKLPAKLPAKLPEVTLRALSNLDVTRIYKDKSFSSYLEDSIVHLAEFNETDNTMMELFLLFWFNLTATASFLGTPEDTQEVQDTVNEVYRSLIEIDMEGEDDAFKGKLDEEVYADEFLEAIQDMLSIPVLKQMINLQFEDGASEYIIRAVQVFTNKKISDKMVKQEGEE